MFKFTGRAVGILVVAVGAMATPGVARAALFDYNLVVTNTHRANGQEVEGRSFVQNLQVSNSINFGNSTLAGTTDVLNVANSLTGGPGIAIQRGVFRHTNAIPNGFNVNLNGGATSVTTPVSIVPLADEMSATSSLLAALTPNSTYSAPTNGSLTFSLGFDPAGRAVVNLPASVFSVQNLQFNSLPTLSSGQSLIINVTGLPTTANSTLNYAINGNGSAATSAQVLWNFATATPLNLNLNGRFTGSILAPTVSLTNSTAIEGGVYVQNFTQNGEVHHPLSGVTSDPTPAFRGVVPEPTAALVLAPLALLAIRRR